MIKIILKNFQKFENPYRKLSKVKAEKTVQSANSKDKQLWKNSEGRAESAEIRGFILLLVDDGKGQEVLQKKTGWYREIFLHQVVLENTFSMILQSFIETVMLFFVLPS